MTSGSQIFDRNKDGQVSLRELKKVERGLILSPKFIISIQVTEILGTVLTKVIMTLLNQDLCFIIKDEVDEFMREADKVKLWLFIITS